MTLTLRPVRVATGSDEDGMLVLFDEVHLSDENEVAPGGSSLETGFGRYLDGLDHPTFPSLDAAQAWIAERIAARGRDAGRP